MADNQITPFQLTDQFTMDNFNQRINETNTALQNKAEKIEVSESDNGKFMRVVNGAWTADEIPSANGVNF